MSRVADEMDDLFDEEEGESLDVLLMAEDADTSHSISAHSSSICFPTSEPKAS